jgi:hypothetical protein
LNSCKHEVPDLNDAPSPVTSPTNIPVANGLLQFGPGGVFVDPEVISQLRAEVCGKPVCKCGAEGFVVPQGAATCERCLHPCELDPCATSADAENTCVKIDAPAGRRLSQQSLFSAYGNYDNFGLDREVCSTVFLSFFFAFSPSFPFICEKIILVPQATLFAHDVHHFVDMWFAQVSLQF